MVTEADQNRVLRFLVSASGTGNVMEALQWGADHFDEGFAVANDMQNRDMVKLLYSNYNKNLIVVELTLLGEREGEKIKAT